MVWWPTLASQISPEAQCAIRSFWGPGQDWESIPWTICAMRSAIMNKESLMGQVLTVVGESGPEAISLLIGWLPVDDRYEPAINTSLESVRVFARWASKIGKFCGSERLASLLRGIPNMSSTQMDSLSRLIIPTCRDGFHSFSVTA